MEKQIIHRVSRVEVEQTFSRYLIKNDTIYESRFGLTPNQKIVYERPNFEWVITNEHKMIGEYKAFKSTMSYYGRDYEAWFCYELPILAGPYIFGGLPGLILEIYDSELFYKISLAKIEKVEVMPKENLTFLAEKITLLEGIKLQHKAIDKALLPLKMIGKENIIATTADYEQWRETILERIER